jgi:hypothetical protein
MKTKITQAFVERVPLSPGRNATYTDCELRGFMLIVGATGKRYYAQTLVNGRQVRVKVGDHPTLNAREAREAARQRLANMKAGNDPNEDKRRARARGLTLRQALELHIAAKDRSPVTVRATDTRSSSTLPTGSTSRSWTSVPIGPGCASATAGSQSATAGRRPT